MNPKAAKAIRKYVPKHRREEIEQIYSEMPWHLRAPFLAALKQAHALYLKERSK